MLWIVNVSLLLQFRKGSPTLWFLEIGREGVQRESKFRKTHLTRQPCRLQFSGWGHGRADDGADFKKLYSRGHQLVGLIHILTSSNLVKSRVGIMEIWTIKNKHPIGIWDVPKFYINPNSPHRWTYCFMKNLITQSIVSQFFPSNSESNDSENSDPRKIWSDQI